MKSLVRNAMLLVANLLLPIGVLFFMMGYFRGQPPPTLNDIAIPPHRHSQEPAPFDRVILMVVDALRSDFVYGENTGFNYTQGLIRSGVALPFTARAASPTLTMSRVKAMTQGTSQTFLDVWLNIANSPNAVRQKDTDTWLARMKYELPADKKMVYYGTKTWISLYPDIWDRTDGVDSYYVPDHTIVDSNITRHITEELASSDWKAMVMHFPGLDHVAHQGGPKSAHMLGKQMQMDNIVREIYVELERQAHLQNALLILAGDHGMNEKGNHGGASPGEIASTMTFITPRLRALSPSLESPVKGPVKDYEYYSVIEQVDLVPTLAGLLGFSIPSQSIGAFISQLQGLFPDPDYATRFMLYNAEQVMKLFVASKKTAVSQTAEEQNIFALWNKTKEAESAWIRSPNAESRGGVANAGHTFCLQAQKLLGNPVNTLNYPRLAAGILCLLGSIVLLAIASRSLLVPLSNNAAIFISIVFFHALTMFSGPLVVEEHHYWYWTSLLWIGYLGVKSFKSSKPSLGFALPAILQFLSQCLNQSGDTEFFIPDAADELIRAYPWTLWITVAITYFWISRSIAKCLPLGSVVSFLVSSIVGTAAFIFKLASAQKDSPESVMLLPQAATELLLDVDHIRFLRFLWTCLAGLAVMVTLHARISRTATRRDILFSLSQLANLYLALQTRPKSHLLHLIFYYQVDWLLSSDTGLDAPGILVTVLVLGQSSFFSFGESNSIASIDIHNGFNGIEGYPVVPVFEQTILSNWIGPVWWTIAGLQILASRNRHSSRGPRGVQQTANRASPNGVIHRTNGVGANGIKQGTQKKDNGAVAKNANGRQSVGDVIKTSDSSSSKTSSDDFFEYLVGQTFFTTSSSLAVMLACIWLRDSADLWIVLAPKYIYVGLWTAFQQLQVNFLLCIALWTTGGLVV